MRQLEPVFFSELDFPPLADGRLPYHIPRRVKKAANGGEEKFF